MGRNVETRLQCEHQECLVSRTHDITNTASFTQSTEKKLRMISFQEKNYDKPFAEYNSDSKKCKNINFPISVHISETGPSVDPQTKARPDGVAPSLNLQ